MTTRSEALRITWSKGHRNGSARKGQKHGDDARSTMREVWAERKRKVSVYDEIVRIVEEHELLKRDGLSPVDGTPELLQRILQALTSNR